MALSIREVLFGSDYSRFEHNLGILGAVTLFGATFAAYALDLFAVSGGVIVLPGDATTVGIVAAALIGYRSGGMLFAWLSFFAAYLGFRADWAFLGLSGRDIADKLAFFFDPVGLAILAVVAVLIGTLAFGAGVLVRRSLELVRREAIGGNS